MVVIADHSVKDLERLKFTTDSNSEVAVRVLAEILGGVLRPSGLTTGGLITEVTLNNTTWTALPPTALTDRNAISIQNRSGGDIVINYDNGVSGLDGVLIPDQYERHYGITDSIVIYAKSIAASATITIEELA